MGDDDGVDLKHYRSGFWNLCQDRGAPVTTCKRRGDGCLLGCTALWCPACAYSEITGRMTSEEFEYGNKGNPHSKCEQCMSCACFCFGGLLGNVIAWCNPITALVHLRLRDTMNHRFNQSETRCEACCAVWFCPACSLAQIYREISFANPEDPVTHSLVGAPRMMMMERTSSHKHF